MALVNPRRKERVAIPYSSDRAKPAAVARFRFRLMSTPPSGEFLPEIKNRPVLPKDKNRFQII
jgi:hypothetical protein